MAVSLSQDGTRALSGSLDKTLKIWDTRAAIASTRTWLERESRRPLDTQTALDHITAALKCIIERVQAMLVHAREPQETAIPEASQRAVQWFAQRGDPTRDHKHLSIAAMRAPEDSPLAPIWRAVGRFL